MTAKELSKTILYKGVNPFLSRTRPQKRFVILHEIMRSQMQWFEEFIALVDTLPATDVTLTFDDGFYSSYETIKRLKNRKAIFFVCPEFINRAEKGNWQDFFHHNLLRTENLNNKELSDAVRPATWDNLRELVRLGHTIGSHTMNHARLSGIVLQKELEKEIIGSADIIENQLNVKVDAIACPFGNVKSINERACAVMQKRYRWCFTGIRGNNYGREDSLIQWRDTIHFPWTREYVRFLLRGGFDWYYARARARVSTIGNI